MTRLPALEKKHWHRISEKLFKSMLSEQRATLITYFAFLAIVASAGVLIVFAHRGIAPCLLAMGLIAAFAPTLWQDGKRALHAGIGQKAPQGLLFLILFGMTLWIAITALWSPIGLSLIHI